MRTKSKLARVVWCCAAGLFLVSCEPVEVEPAEEDDTGPELLLLRKENQQLHKEIDTLRDDAQTQHMRYETLSARSDRLAEELRTLQKDYERQKELLAVLRELPAERDKYKQEAERGRAKIVRLEMDVRELKKQLEAKKESGEKNANSTNEDEQRE
jgi:uncharacterized coiled-coil DUF342 family protein